MTRPVAMVVALVTLAMLCQSIACADQHHAALPTLLTQLRETPNRAAANALEQQVWALWFEAPSAQASRLFEQGRKHAQAGAVQESLASFERLVQEYPDFAEAWNQRAIVRFLLDDVDGALADVEKTLSLEPRHFGALTGRAQCYLRRKNPRAALAAFEAALAIDPWLAGVPRQVELLRAHLGAQPSPI